MLSGSVFLEVSLVKSSLIVVVKYIYIYILEDNCFLKLSNKNQLGELL